MKICEQQKFFAKKHCAIRFAFMRNSVSKKSLKALLVHYNNKPPRTPSNAELLRLLPEASFGDLRAELLEVDDFYLSTRYPDALLAPSPTFKPSESEAEEAYNLAALVYERKLQLTQNE